MYYRFANSFHVFVSRVSHSAIQATDQPICDIIRNRPETKDLHLVICGFGSRRPPQKITIRIVYNCFAAALYNVYFSAVSFRVWWLGLTMLGTIVNNFSCRYHASNVPLAHTGQTLKKFLKNREKLCSKFRVVRTRYERWCLWFAMFAPVSECRNHFLLRHGV